MHYETSAHARPGYECRHNVNYWRFGDYLGIGAGAHSKISFPDRVVRQVRFKKPQQYLEQAEQGAPLIEEHEVTRAEIGFEFMLNALRLADGVPVDLFRERTGFPADAGRQGSSPKPRSADCSSATMCICAHRRSGAVSSTIFRRCSCRRHRARGPKRPAAIVAFDRAMP